MSEHQSGPSSIIHTLPPEISNKIAAGEVIQRPSSVVKELLDNAIDSGADQIGIMIQNAGRSLIKVVDNGCGMGKDDLSLCFERHATSKIFEVDDLFRVQTLGFRGEAMASIGSIAQVSVKSRRHEDEMGFHYEVWGGEEKKMEPIALDVGTTVEVRNLFYNVPARRQFLKTDATELRHILRAVQQAAMARPEIGFKVEADGDLIYQMPRQSLQERIAGLFGKRYRASLIPVQEETSYVHIRGFLADPKLTKKSRGEQFFFVNNRPFQHRLLAHIVLEQYSQWMNQGEYPFFALFFDVDPQEVDVNVHPAKSEVKFEDEQSIVRFTKSVVRKGLNQNYGVPSTSDNPDELEITKGERQGASAWNLNTAFGGGFHKNRGGDSNSEESEPVSLPSRINFEKNDDKNSGKFQGGHKMAEKLYQQDDSGTETDGQKTIDYDKAYKQEQESQTTVSARNFWQLHRRFILTQTRSGLSIIDQHAAHKRILFEKAIQSADSALPSTQQLLFARNVELSATEYQMLKQILSVLHRMGFNIQLLSGNTAMILGVPAEVERGDEGELLREILQQYNDLQQSNAGDNIQEKVAIAFASQTAIPKGKPLHEMEMEILIDQLFACSNPYSEPEGKPIMIYMSVDDLASKFRS